jgi:hypothetical protein
MSAIVIILPVVAKPHFDDPAWEEQRIRELQAKLLMRQIAPPRTRPIVVPKSYREQA